MKRVAIAVVSLLVLLVLSNRILVKGVISQIPVGTWAPAGNGVSLSSPRAGAATVLIQDGRVLITGGDPGTGAVSSADIFDTSGNFSAAASMHYPRSEHTATVLADGTVLVTGGLSGGTAIATAEIYNPTANTWTDIPGKTMISARSGHTASLLQDGTVLVAGGDNQGTAQSTLEIYDPTSGTFSLVGTPLSSPRELHAAAVLQSGQVIIVGGQCAGSSQNCPAGTGALASSDIYSPSSGSVSAGPLMTTARLNVSATTQLDGKVLAAGGYNATLGDLNSAEVYDPSSNTWSLAPGTLATARQGHQAFLLPHSAAILIVGGTTTVGGVETATSSVEMYYPLASGTDAPANWNGTFNATASMASARTGATGASPSNGSPSSTNDGLLLVAGGKDATGTALSSSELYGFAWVKTDATDYAPGTTVNITGGGWQPGETVTLHFQEVPYYDSHPDLTATVQSDGTFSNSQFSPDSHDVSIRFYLYATGSQSGLQAQTTFTDNKTVTVAVVGTGSGSVTSSPAGITCTDTGGTASGTCSVSVGNTLQVTLTATPTSPSTIGDWTVPGYTINSGCTASSTTCTFTLNNTSQTITVQFNPGAVTAGNSTLSVSPTSVVADGTTTSTITATLKDSGGNPVSGKTVSLTAGSGSSTITTVSGTTNASGQATFTVKDTVVESVTYTAKDTTDSITVTHTATVSFTAVSTTTTVTSSANPSTYGGSVTFTATVAPTSGTTAPTGSVQFVVDGTNFGSAVTLTTGGSCPTDDGCASSSATTTLTAGTHTVTANYTATGSFSGSSGTLSGGQTVNKAALTVTANNQTKTYGRTVAFGSGSTQFTSTGLQNSETIGSVTLAVSNNGGAATAPVSGSPYTITPSAATGGTFTASNYTITYATGTLTVSAAALTVTASNQTKNYGQTVTFGSGSTQFTSTGLQNSETIGSVTLAVNNNGGAATAPVSGSPYTITPSAATGGTFTASNYTITYATGTLTVSAVALTVTASSGTMTYGGTPPTITASYSGFVNGESATNLTTQPTCSTTATSSSPASPPTYPSTCTGAVDSNYTISYVAGSVTVNKATPTVTFGTAPTPTYLGGNFTVSATTTNTDSTTLTYSYVSGPCVLVSGATFSSSGAGTCVVKASGAVTTNFNAASAQQSVTIAKATPTVTFGTAPTPTYLGGNFTVSATTTNTDSTTLTYSYLSGSCAFVSGATFSSSGAGTCVVQASGTATTNFLAASSTQSVTIAKATPTLSVTNSPVTYNGSAQAATVSGSVPGTVSNILTGGAASQTTVGTSAVTANFTPTDTTDYNSLTGASAGNFVINKATPTLSVTNSPVTYTGSAQAATVSGSVPGSVSSILTGGAASQTTAGTYAVTANFTPTDSTDYNSLTAASAGNFVINKATPTLSVTNSPLTYNGSAQPATVSSSVTGTVSNILTGGAASQTTAGTYAVTANFTPTDSTDYSSLTAASAGNFVIQKATPTLSVTNSPVTYNGSAQAATASGSVAGTVSSAQYNGSATVPTNAGTYTITANFTPTDSTDYSSLTAASAGNFVIQKATPTLSVTNSPVTYNGSAQAATVSSGSVTGTISNVEYGGSSTVPTSAGTYAITANFAPTDTTDYNSLTAASAGNFVINKATPTLSVTNSPVTYNGSAQAATVSGSVPGTVSNILTGGAASQTAAGTYAVTANFAPTDSTNYSSLTAASAGNFVINKATPTITFGAAPTPTYLGGNFTVSATTTNTDSTTLTYSQTSGPCALVSGATFSSSGAGTCMVEASGAATTNFLATSNTQSVTIAKATPIFSPALTSPAAITYGTASVSLPPNTGTMVLFGGTRAASPDTVTITISGLSPIVTQFNGSSGTFGPATFNPSTLPVGTYTITYTYSGNANISSLTDTSTTLVVNKAAATVTLNNLTQTYTGSPLSPTVTTSPSGLSYSLSGAPDTNAGSYPVTATVNDANYTGSASGTFTINKASSTTGISASPSSITIGQSTTVTATVSPQHGGTPSGTVNVSDGFTGTGDTCTITLSGGTGQCTLTPTAIGSLTVTGGYNGDGNFAGSSGTTSLSVTGTPPSFMSAASATFTAGVGGSFTVTTSGIPKPSLSESGTLPGTVTFTDNGNGTATIAGTATLAGSYPITITAANVVGSAMQAFTLAVSPGAFAQLQLLVPGETAAPGTTNGKTGTPNIEYVNGAFNVTVNAVDQYFNLVNTVTDTVQFTSTDTNPATHLPANTALVEGTATFSVTLESGSYNPATTTLTASDYTDNTKTADTSPVIPVIVVYTATINPTMAGTGDATAYTLTVNNAANPNSNNLGSVTVAVPQFGGTPSNVSVTAANGATAVNWTVDTNPPNQYATGYITVRECTTNDTAPPCNGLGGNDVVPGGTISIQFTATATNSISGATMQNVWNTTAYSDAAYTSGLPLAPPEPTVTIGQPPAITNANTTTFTYGAAGTFTVQATGYPTPSLTESGSLPSGVTFTDNKDGSATLAGTPGSAGTFPITITAHNGYGTDATQNFTLTVNAAATTTSLSAPTVTYPANGVVTVTASSAAGTPTGSATLSVDGGSPLSAALNGSGVATFTLTSPNAGSHSLSASYAAQGNFAASGPTTGSLTVNAAATTTSLSAPTVTYPANGVVTVTVSSTAGTPTGNATLTVDSGTPLTQALNGSGVATFTLTSPSAGSHTLSASYAAQGNFAASGPTTGSLTVNAAATTTTLNAPTITYNANGSVTVTVTPTAGTPGGNVTLSVDGGTAVSKALASGSATFTNTDISALTSPNAGSHSLSASYAAQGNFAASTGTGTLTVNPASTTTTIASAPTVIYPANGAVTVTVSSTAGTPAGNASLVVDGGTPLYAPLSGGTATFTLTIPSPGIRSLSASYAAQGNFAASGPTAGALTVDEASAITSDNSTTFTAGIAGTFAVTATGFPVPALTESGSLPSGATFTDNGNGTATLAGTTTTAGTYPITVTAQNGIVGPATQAFTLTVSPGAFARLQLLVPGETPAPGADPGKTGTPNTEYVNGQFQVTVNAVDQYWNVVNTVTDTVAITSNDTKATLAANAALVAGTGTLNVTLESVSYNPATTTLTASDYTDNTKTADTSPVIPVIVVYTATISPTDWATGQKATYTLTVNNANSPNTNNLASVEVAVPEADQGSIGNVTVTAAQSGGSPEVNWTYDPSGLPGMLRFFANTTNDAVTPGSTITITFDATSNATVDTTPVVENWNTTAFLDAASQNALPLAPPEPSVNLGAAPKITSDASTSAFTYATAGTTFTVTTTGVPTPSLSESGSFPSWATFKDNGDGTATISGTPTAAGSSTFTITAHNGYGNDDTQSFTLTVKAVALTITASSATVNYGDAAPAITAGYSGFVNGDDASKLTTQPTCSTAYTKGSPVSGSPYTTSCTGAADTNYTISYVNGTATVKAVALIITASSATVNYGDAAPAITAGYSGFVNGDDASKLTTQPTCSTAYTKGSPVSGSPYTTSCTGAADTNYTISYVNGTATVKAVALIITASSATVNYGDAAPAITAGYSGFVNGDDASKLTTQPTCSTAYTKGSPVSGSPYTTSCTGAADTNYTISYVNGTATVKAVALIITASSATVNYGDAAPAITAGYSGFVNGDDASKLTTQPTCSTAYTKGSPVSGSPYTTSCTGAADTNYTIGYTAGTVTVQAVALTITASSTMANYGSAVPAITASYSGFVNEDSAASLTTPPICTTAGHGSPSGSAVGTYASNCSAAVDNNYIIGYVAGTVTIAAVPLNITASSPFANYGSVVPAITPSYSGFVNGDTATSLTTPPTCSTAAHGSPSGSPVGTYPSTCTGAVDSDYTISYTPGAVTIQAVPLIITASGSSFTYGGSPVVVGPIASGFVNGDGLGNLTTQPTCLPVFSSTTTPGAYPTSCSGAADSNYAISYAAGSVTVSQASTTTAVISSSPNNTSTYMQLVTFTATVADSSQGSTGTPTGTVNFYNGASLISPVGGVALGLANGQDVATFSTTSLPDGGSSATNNITAVYSGDTNFVTSISPAVAQVVEAAPNVSLSPLFVSFGNLNVGQKSTATVTLTNIGDASLGSSSAPISVMLSDTVDFSQTNNCPNSLGYTAPNNLCTITVTFKPADTGVIDAALTITDNDDDSSGAQQIVSLTGAGLSTIAGGSLYTDAIFATSSNCGALTLSGGSTVDSFNSGQGYSSSHQLSGGNVGTDGNLTLNGSNAEIYGTAYAPSATTGNCNKTGVTGLTTSGGAKVTGGVVTEGQVTYPNPPAPSPAPPTTTQNISGSCPSGMTGCTNDGSKAVILAPGSYGNVTVSGGTTAHFSAGTYNINSLTLSGKNILYVDSGPVVVNLAGALLSGANPAMDVSGGSIQNPTGIPANLQFTYAGSRGINLSGGSGSYATVFAPNALLNMSGGTDFFGGVIGSTITNSGGTAMHYDTALPNIAAGNYIWFNAVVNNVSGLPKSGGQVKLYLTDSTISFTANGIPYSVPVPNAVVTFNSASAKSPTTIYDSTNSRWSTSIPVSDVGGNTFVAGVAFPVPSNFPSGIQNVTWSAAFSTDTTGVTLQWQWGAAVYSSFSTTYATSTNTNVLGVNAEDGSADTNGTDPAGTPETYKGSVLFGGTGGGLANYTGYWSVGSGVVPTIAPMSVSPSSLDFGGQTQGITTVTPLTAVLTNNDSNTHNFTGSGIQIGGTNVGDFALVPNGAPNTPNNCVGMSSLASGASCMVYLTFTPSDGGTRTAKVVVNDDANNAPQTMYLTGTGQ